MRQRLHQLAYYDALTHLPNRQLFMDRVQQVLIDARRYQPRFALMFMDLDRFKSINDTLGHTTGGQLLNEVSRRLSTWLRELDTVSRMGGDEFMLLVPRVKSVDDSRLVAEKMLKVMREPFKLQGRHYHVSVSIGISH